MSSRFPAITAVMLVGGKSRRMGQDKAFLEVDGLPLIERLIQTLQGCFDQLLLVGDRPERFAHYGIPIVPDIYPGSSLGGLYTGLKLAATEQIFVTSCDIPFPNPSLIRLLCSQEQGCDAVVPVTAKGLEPLFAMYRRSCLSPMQAALEKGDFRIMTLLKQLQVLEIGPEKLGLLDPADRCLLNLNTPDDYAACRVLQPVSGPLVISFVAYSGTGKTTLLEQVIPILKERGYKVGVIKHDAHRFEIDHPGKDSYRLTAAGADSMLLCSGEKLALVRRHLQAPPIAALLELCGSDLDIILTEGFKQSSLPKIELHRASLERPLICRGERSDETLIAVATDSPLELDVPLLDLNEPQQIADFIIARIAA